MYLTSSVVLAAGAFWTKVRDDDRLHVRRQQGAHGEVVVIAISGRGSEAGSYLRPIDFCVTQL